jgi:hypothetical protein
MTTTRKGAACMLVALTFASALGLAGCSGSSGNSAQPGPGGSTSATSSSRAAPSSGSYDSSSDVVSALKSAGHPCAAVSGGQDTSLSAPGLRSASSCTISGSQTVTATVFDDHTDAEAYATLLTSAGVSGLLIGSKSERAVLGGNWVVLVPDDAAYASQVSAALGGTVLGGSSSSASAD